MDTIEVNLKLDKKEYPILCNLKKKELDKLLLKIFKSGYMIHFPSNDRIEQQVEYNEIIERINSVKDEIKDQIVNSEIGNKIDSLESSLSKLIGLSSNSCKKGNFGENVLEEIFSQRYGDIVFERMNTVAHSGDAWLKLPDNKIIMLESKNYTTTVNKDEIAKLKSDMINHHIKWGILASFNSPIQGMKELDFITFNHNNEMYSIVMISNMSNDIHKLDLGLMILRKLITQLDNMQKFPWIVEDITKELDEFNQIIMKNYALRDSYYNMERDVIKSLSNYHILLRDYQYDIEKKAKEIMTKIQSTMIESIKTPEDNTHQIIDKYQDKKILPLVVRIVDTIQHKKWTITYDNESEWILNHNNSVIGHVRIQAKKAIISMVQNDMTLNLNLGKDKENKQNLEIIKSL